MLLALNSHSHRIRPSLRGVLARAVAAVLSAPARYLDHRRLLSTMAAMSDAELRDIGLSRPDVSDATALPLGSDVGLFLSSRAHDRDRYAVRR